MTLAQIWLLVAVLGAAAVVAGVALLAGAPWALITGGVMAIVGAVLLVDPSEIRGRR
ncbi:hypothetical protein LTT66_18280 [Nocardia gipuzkoensis]|jgi:hypothetical protein|uniref:hypothetical protein n=1 Tax=Nocardia gipuzkoensis TaxID=2749991 RepID=UPI001E3B7C46|nr:hypothetical protein [Nocardia gipuzkoensis]UGT65318.1 hypothetical protein LTT66_18280 [Nocardia gipuzkoensis]